MAAAGTLTVCAAPRALVTATEAVADVFDPLPARVAKAFVVIEMSDGGAIAYAIDRPEDVNLQTLHHYERGDDPWSDRGFRVPRGATHDLTFSFDHALGYTMVHMAPGTWGGVQFDRPAIEAGESRD